MKLTKAFGPFCLALFLVTWMFVPGAQASVVFNADLVSPGFYNGTGTVNGHFTVDTELTNLELGLRVATRNIAPITPGPNSNIYSVQVSPGPLATWNFEFSVNTRAVAGTAVLNDFLYAMTVMDVSTGISGPTFDPVRGIPDDSGFGPAGKTGGVTLTTQWGAQNSENPGFTGFLPGFNATRADLYKITLSATTLSGAPAASVSVFASTVPEPGTMVLIATALIGIGSLSRKRSRKTA